MIKKLEKINEFKKKNNNLNFFKKKISNFYVEIQKIKKKYHVVVATSLICVRSVVK